MLRLAHIAHCRAKMARLSFLRLSEEERPWPVRLYVRACLLNTSPVHDFGFRAKGQLTAPVLLLRQSAMPEASRNGARSAAVKRREQSAFSTKRCPLSCVILPVSAKGPCLSTLIQSRLKFAAFRVISLCL